MKHVDILKAEVSTWLIEDDEQRKEKFRRERIRHYKLVRDLLLDRLGTASMDVLEVGGGPMPVSDLLPFDSRIVVDPLSDEYRKVLPCPDHWTQTAERIDYDEDFDLAIATNSLDHVEDPALVVGNMKRALRPGGYMAICCAENNSYTHPHPAHIHSLNADLIHRWVDGDFETIWELTYAKDGYRYGWVEYEGKRGQPAFAILLRKCSGYATS